LRCSPWCSTISGRSRGPCWWEHLATTNPLLQLRLQAIAAWNPGAQERALALLSQQVDRQASLLAYGDVFRMVGLMFLLALPLVLLLGRPERQDSVQEPGSSG
jgi:DHA2 family multidrug resistance protein